MVELRGIGLHSGEPAAVRLHAAEGPVRFKVGQEVFRPVASRVVSTQRCTTLGSNSAQLMTVEHLLAALFIRGIWEGLLIEVDGPEIPILDGSAQEWLGALEQFPSTQCPKALLAEPLRLEKDGSSIIAQPDASFSLNVTAAFKHPKIGYQQLSCPPVDLKELALARTFGFLRDIQELKAQGLIQGASNENAVIFSEQDSLTPLRLRFEPVYHKALDFLGDLYLAGRPYNGRFTVHRGSHSLHVALAKQLEQPREKP